MILLQANHRSQEEVMGLIFRYRYQIHKLALG